MTVEQTGVIDYIGVEIATGKVVLTIVDHLEWTDVSGHVSLLQEKVNRYLAFVECGEIAESFPAGQGRDDVISLRHWLPLSEDDYAVRFLRYLRETLTGVGIEFRVEEILHDVPS
jgi:hypothetical protein